MSDRGRIQSVAKHSANKKGVKGFLEIESGQAILIRNNILTYVLGIATELVPRLFKVNIVALRIESHPGRQPSMTKRQGLLFGSPIVQRSKFQAPFDFV